VYSQSPEELQKEKLLLVRLNQGDSRAFEELYDSYKLRLAGNLYKLLKSDELAKEVLQDLFLKVWDNRAQIDPEKSFRSYLFRIGENMVNDFYRRAARDKRLRDQLVQANSEIYSHIEEQLFFKEDSGLLKEAIELMPPQRKLVYTLCKMEGRSYKEVEELLGINAKTINSHLFQANKFLKEHFNPTSGVSMAIILAAVLKGI
jgi:RNA polymerase sigma-70 factor (family 1)